MPVPPRRATASSSSANAANIHITAPTLGVFAVYSAQVVPPSSAPSDNVEDNGEDTDDVREERDQRGKMHFLYCRTQASTRAGGGGGGDERSRRKRVVGTVLGMQDFARMIGGSRMAPAAGAVENGALAAAGPVRSVHSSRRRMIWIEPEPGWSIHATIDLPSTSTHSRGPSAQSSTSASVADVSAIPTFRPALEDDVLISQLEAAHAQFRLLHGSLTGLAKREGREGLQERVEAYWNAWIKTWDVAARPVTSFEQVVGGQPRRSPVLTPVTSSQIRPLLNQFALSNPTALPILLHGSDVLSLPSLGEDELASRPSLSSEDLDALVRYLSAIVSESHAKSTLTLRDSSSSSTAANTTSALATTAAASSSSRWNTYTLGMAGYIAAAPSMAIPAMALPIMPSLPIPSMPSMSMLSLSSTPPPASTTIPHQIAASEVKAAESSSTSTWGFKKPSWTSAFGGNSSGSSTPKSASEKATQRQALIDSAQAAPSDDLTSLQAQAFLAKASATAGQAPTQLELPVDTQPRVDTPAVEIEAQTVDDLALKEAMLAESSFSSPAVGDVDDGALGGAAEASEREKDEGDQQVGKEGAHDEDDRDEEAEISPERVLKLFSSCGRDVDADGGDAPFEVRLLERGPLTLALATLPMSDNEAEGELVQWLMSRAARLLEAVETIVELVSPLPAPYPHRHLRLRQGVSAAAHHWQPSVTAAAQVAHVAQAEEDEVGAALYDCLRGYKSDPPIIESFVRLSSSQWVISRRAEDANASAASTGTQVSNASDVYIVLPAKVGKEGSLVDAAEELRRFDRAFAKDVDKF